MKLVCKSCICVKCINDDCWIRRCIGICNCEKNPQIKLNCIAFEISNER